MERRTVIASVLDSLRLHLPQLTLKSVQAELQRWQETGLSVFRRLVQTLNLPALTRPESIRTPLDLLVPIPQTSQQTRSTAVSLPIPKHRTLHAAHMGQLPRPSRTGGRGVSISDSQTAAS